MFVVVVVSFCERLFLLLLFCCQFLREILPPSVLITRDPLTSVDLLSDLAAALRRECRLLSEAVRETIAVG